MATLFAKRTAGNISILGRPIEEVSVPNNLALTAQDNILWDKLSIADHFQVMGKILGLPDEEIENRKRFLEHRMGLDKEGKRAEVLSGGNKRKLSTALTLFAFKDLSFLDEPTTGLDPKARRNLLQLVRTQLKSGLFTTHRLDEAEFLCDSIVILMNGKIVAEGTASQLREAYADYYFVLLNQPKQPEAERMLKERFEGEV